MTELSIEKILSYRVSASDEDPKYVGIVFKLQVIQNRWKLPFSPLINNIPNYNYYYKLQLLLLEITYTRRYTQQFSRDETK